MGMTIDEHIAQLKKLKSFHNGSYGESINFAIDIMRKYQKIEQIYKEWNIDFGEQDNLTLLKIGGVLNGNEKILSF